MGFTPVNTALGVLRGRIDDYVFREVEGKVVVARRPRGFSVPPSAPQVAAQDRFRNAAAYAKAVFDDPARRQPYQDLASERGITSRRLFGRVLKDFVEPPVITAINATAYARQIGDPIRIMAKDDWLVAGVKVQIKRPDGTVIESGDAAYVGPDWVYQAQTAAPAEPPVTIEVTARDLPGGTATRSELQLGTFPVIDAIDVTGYHGQVGNPIVVRARDDVGVTSVEVLLRTAAGAVIENPAAVRVGDAWRAIATVAVPLGSTVTVIASAFDAEGNDVAKELGLVVA